MACLPRERSLGEVPDLLVPLRGLVERVGCIVAHPLLRVVVRVVVVVLLRDARRAVVQALALALAVHREVQRRQQRLHHQLSHELRRLRILPGDQLAVAASDHRGEQPGQERALQLRWLWWAGHSVKGRERRGMLVAPPLAPCRRLA